MNRRETALLVLALLILAALYYLVGPGKGPAWDRPVTAEVIGREFQWWFRYPGSDGRLGTRDDIESERFLMLPPGVDVTLLVTSDDYVYTLTLPGYDLKQIAVPGLIHELHFRTHATGTFDLLVDPLCGFRYYHDELMGQVVIEPRSDFAESFGTRR